MTGVSEPLDCGHRIPDAADTTADAARLFGYAYTAEGSTICYPCADAQAKRDLLALSVGENYGVYVRLGHPYGPFKMTDDVPGEITTWSGGHLGWMVPGRLTLSRGRGFRGATTTKFYFRAVVRDGDSTVLVAGQTSGDGMLSNVKRIIDRPTPGSEHPAHRTRGGNPGLRRVQPYPKRSKDFDYADTEEL